MNGVCPRCGMYGTDGETLARNIAEYVGLIPEEIKTDDHIYKERLAVCGDCDALRGGMCGECGCYIEVRAAKKQMNCPVNKW